MDGMRPILAFITYGPNLGRPIFNLSLSAIEVSSVFAVDRPDAASVVKLPHTPALYFVQVDFGKLKINLNEIKRRRVWQFDYRGGIWTINGKDAGHLDRAEAEIEDGSAEAGGAISIPRARH